MNLLNNIDEDVFTSAICCIDGKGSNNYKETIDIFEIKRLHKFDLRWKQISVIINKYKPNILHIWSPFVIASTLPSKYSKLRIQILSTYISTHRIDGIVNFVHALGLLFVDKITSNIFEEEMIEPFKQIYQMKSGELIFNGIDLSLIESEKEINLKKFGIEPTLPKILYVGRLFSDKNIKVLLESIDILAQEIGIKAQLILCGTGEDEYPLKQYGERLGITNQLFFMGFRYDVYRFMKSCDIFVLPSFREGLSNALLEAMASRIPIIASNIPVHKRWIIHKHNGLLFDPTDPNTLARAINEILNSPSEVIEKLVTNGYVTASELSMERMVQHYENLYTRLLN